MLRECAVLAAFLLCCHHLRHPPPLSPSPAILFIIGGDRLDDDLNLTAIAEQYQPPPIKQHPRTRTRFKPSSRLPCLSRRRSLMYARVSNGMPTTGLETAYSSSETVAAAKFCLTGVYTFDLPFHGEYATWPHC